MGTGIMGAIPVSFRFGSSPWRCYSTKDALENNKTLPVYRGSYKAVFEEYSSLLHMKRLLWSAMKHPLAKVVRIGMSL